MAHIPDEANNDCNNQDDNRNYTNDDNYEDDTNYGDDSNYDNFNATVSDIFADNKDIFSCRHCDKSYSTKQRKNIHERTHEEESSFICPQCNKGFCLKASLQVMIMFHHSIQIMINI